MSAIPVLEARELSIAFGGVQAVREVTLKVMRGELICIIGPNGAGKSSLLDLISGTVKASSGDVSVNGTPLRGGNPGAFARAGVIRKFQGTNIFQGLSVRDNLIVAAAGVASLRVAAGPSSEALLEMAGLADCADEKAEFLPHGRRQWLEIAMAMMCQPSLLLLDEPCAGMNVGDAPVLARLLRNLNGKIAVVIIEHDMKFVRSLRSRTLVMHQGAIVRDGDFATLETDREIREIYLGRRARERECCR